MYKHPYNKIIINVYLFNTTPDNPFNQTTSVRYKYKYAHHLLLAALLIRPLFILPL